MPSNDAVRGLDGDEWVIEGVSQGKYHFVERWCATDEKPKETRTGELQRFLQILGR
jgi:hypothetical protein